MQSANRILFVPCSILGRLADKLLQCIAGSGVTPAKLIHKDASRVIEAILVGLRRGPGPLIHVGESSQVHDGPGVALDLVAEPVDGAGASQSYTHTRQVETKKYRVDFSHN